MSAGVVAALKAEARTLGSSARRRDGVSATPDGTLVAVSGMGGPAAAAAARNLADAGASALVSWGMAGGLDPALEAGTICLPTTVMTLDGKTFDTDPHWCEILGAAITSGRVVTRGRLLTSERSIDDVAGKAAAFGLTGAAAVDMESVAVAEVAAARGLPFVAVRVIVDMAGDALPPAVLSASRHGQVDILLLLRGLVRAPRDIAPLIRLAGRYRAARRALVAVAGSGALAPLSFGAATTSRVA